MKTEKASSSRAKNPLASARSVRKNEKSTSASASAAAQQLWHKRSGGGLALFVEYYCGQPEGVIVVVSNEDEEKTVAAATSAINETRSIPGGMSRAAQRRRRRKRKRQDVTEEAAGKEEEELISKRDDDESAAAFFVRFRLYDDQLLPTWDRHLRQSPQLITHAERYRAFFGALSTPLPITFRLRRNITSNLHGRLRKELQGFAKYVQPTTFDDAIFHAHSGLHKEALPRTCPQLKTYLNERSQDGTVARQELGSMLPVWLLERTRNVVPAEQTKCRVLDMCASPGSKTLQMAELLLVLPTRGKGTVRANDVHEARLETLKEALSRSGVPGLERAVRFANFDASRYPLPKSEDKMYSVVLCDVPCSGDGTSRKDPHIIPNWLPSIGNKLHGIQLSILLRALQCVAVDGVVSYSTCSLNPVEDEAVVAAALSQMQDTDPALDFEILAVPENRLNGLVLRPGVVHWRVADFSYDANNNDDSGEEEHQPSLKWYDSFQEAKADEMANACETLWPNARSKLHELSRCLRLLPQDHDSGGFFVTLIKRLR